MALKSSFGEYITKEYGLLRQILSYLRPCDLASAKLVCQDWYRAVDSLVDKNPIMDIREMDKNTVPFFTNRKPILPTLVIHQPPAHPLEDGPLMLFQECHVPFIVGLCPCSVIGPDTVYISLSNNGCASQEPCGYDDRASSRYGFCRKFMGFVLPASDQIEVSVFHALPRDPIFKQPITKEVIDRCLGGHGPIKCLLVLSKTGRKAVSKWINNLLTEVVYRQGMTFAIGGGEVLGIECKTKSNVMKRTWLKCDMVLIALRGDNVTAHSDILSAWKEPEVKQFMTKFAKTVGPLPEGSTRMAFLAQCVDRTVGDIETIECNAFREAFPSVPLFGMEAFGEFGVRSTAEGLELSNSERSIKRRRPNITFMDSTTSSFVVLTFKKV